MIILIFPLFLIFTFNDVIRKKTSKDTAFESLKKFFVVTVDSITIHFLTDLSIRRALGSFGLILAFLGVFGEVYQFLTMLANTKNQPRKKTNF